MNYLMNDDSQLELSSKASDAASEQSRYARLQNNSSSDSPTIRVQGESVDDEPPQPVNIFSFSLKLSNFFFFFGSIFYLFTSIWTIVDAYRDAAEEKDYDDDEASDDDEDYDEPFWSVYKLISSLGALMYLTNALVDGRVAFAEIIGQEGAVGRFGGTSPKLEVAAAITFGVAALCDLLSELVWNDDNAWFGYFAGCAAVNIYLVNALLVLSARRPTFKSLPQTLMSAGDILFFIGSIIDVLISLIDNPKAPLSRGIKIAWSSFTSATLWFIDSLLYMLADHLSDNEDDYSSVDSGALCLSEEELEISSASVTESVGSRLHHRPKVFLQATND